MNKNKTLFAAILIMIAAFFTSPLKAQVTIGQLRVPNSTLEVVKLPTGSKTADGVIIPTLTLAELNARQALYTTAQTGAMVYITNSTGATEPGYSDQIICNGIVFWNGSHWVSECAQPKTYAQITSQPKAFTFYELGTETPVALELGAGGSSTMTYQWYKVVGSNVHVNVSAPCTIADGTGFATNKFTPTAIIKGTTLDARNTGFYKYFCVAANQTGDTVTSNIAEVAVGCGAKNLSGQWVSFMCINLGATPKPIALQESTSITLLDNGSVVAYTYRKSANERTLYGDLYQWGRIADGHENRNSIPTNGTGGVDATDNCRSWDTANPPTYEDGNPTNNFVAPWQQVTRGTPYYGKFIKTTDATLFNWYSGPSSNALWSESAFGFNDPCQKVTTSGTVPSGNTPEWYPAVNGPVSSGTGWRIPNQLEWASLYCGGTTSGIPDNAFGNTWSWYQLSASAVEGAKGFELKPDGATTTLFLPVTGLRRNSNALLYYTGVGGLYWSGTMSGANAVGLSISSGNVTPAYPTSRGDAFALRCIKN